MIFKKSLIVKLSFVGIIICSTVELSVLASEIRIQSQPCQVAIAARVMSAHDEKIAKIISQFNEKKDPNFIHRFNNQVRVILHGFPGNGKKSIAKKIAKATDSEFIYHSIADSIREYKRCGVVDVFDLFKRVDSFIFKKKKPVVLYIDKVDLLESEKDVYSLMKSLFNLIEERDRSNQLLIVLSAQCLRMIPDLLDMHFMYGHEISIECPDYAERKRIITKRLATYFISQFDKDKLNAFWFELPKAFIDLHQENHDSLMKNIELLNQSILELADCDSQQDQIKKINDAIQEYDSLKKKFVENVGGVATNDDTVSKIADKYFNCFESYVTNIKTYIVGDKMEAANRIIYWLNKKCEGDTKKEINDEMRVVIKVFKDFKSQYKIAPIDQIKKHFTEEENSKIKDEWSDKDRMLLKLFQYGIEATKSRIHLICLRSTNGKDIVDCNEYEGKCVAVSKKDTGYEYYLSQKKKLLDRHVDLEKVMNKTEWEKITKS